MQLQRRLPQARRRELPVEGDRVARRVGVAALGLVALPQRFRGAGLPIGGAAPGDGRLGEPRDRVELRRRRLRVLQEAQRDPAGVEGRLDARRRAGLADVGAERQGLLRVAEVEQLAQHDAPLGPPFVAVDRPGVARGGQDQVRGLLGAAEPAQPLGAGEDRQRVRLQRLRHGRQGDLGQRRIRHHGGAGLGQRDHVRPRQRGLLQARCDLLLVQEVLGPDAVVLAVDHVGEVVGERRLLPGRQLVVAPKPVGEARRGIRVAQGALGARQGEAPRDGLRR